MVKRKFFFGILLLIIFNFTISASGQTEENELPSVKEEAEKIGRLVKKEELSGFLPIPSLPIYFEKSKTDENGERYISVEMLKIDMNAGRDVSYYFPNQKSNMTMEKYNIDGTTSFVIGGLSAEAGSYIITYDYTNYCDQLIENFGYIENDDIKYLGIARVGVGLRIIANITTTQAGLNISSLSNLGFSANTNTLAGSLTVECIGISSAEITSLFPASSKIDESSIQRALEAIAVIKSKIHDENTIITPQVIELQRASEEVPYINLIEAASKLEFRY